MEQTQSKLISDNLAAVNENIARAAEKAGVEQDTITLVGVSKNRTVEEIRSAIDAGLEHIGENRVQESKEKLPGLERDVVRHFIGHLQRNKVRDVMPLFDLIHSVDSVRLAREIDRRAAAQGAIVDLLMQVNTSGEESKFGVTPVAADVLLEEIGGCKNLRLLGLMTIGPLGGTGQSTAECFAILQNLFEKYKVSSPDNCRMAILSMGMSSDYEIAIAEGSNMVRVGTAIFGPRTY